MAAGRLPALRLLTVMAAAPKPDSAQTHAAAEHRRAILVICVFALIAILVIGILAGLPMGLMLIVIGSFIVATAAYLHLSRPKPQDPSPVAEDDADRLLGMRFAVTLSDALPQPIIVLDRDGRVLHANPLASDLLDIDRMGRPLSIFVRDPGVSDRLSRALDGQASEPLMVHRVTPTESYLSLSFSAATPVEDGSGLEIVLVLVNDVTELILGNQRRADFLANASHELKTPIASMLGYIETLKGHARNDPEARDRFLGIMQQQAERMQRLISDLLSLRRIEQQEHIAPTETADLDLSIRAAIESVAPLAADRDVRLKYKRNKRSIVPGHQDETIQLVLNLIENATKISPPGSSVRIHLTAFDQWDHSVPFANGRLPYTAVARTLNPAPTAAEPIYAVTISDAGPGFAREHIPRIGERFYRIAGDLSSSEKGTGLGLAIVKHIARRHRAGLYLRSEPDVGTEWCIVYRASETADAAADVTSPSNATVM